MSSEGEIKALEFMVAREAQRVLSEKQLSADPARIADGWERRFIADSKRVEEAMRLYEELGYEVCADPVLVDQIDPDCEGCQLVMLFQFKTIYTRKRSET